VTLLKICGLTRAEDVELVDSVAEYAGFIVDPTTSSPRRIRPDDAASLASLLSRAKPVAVFDALSPGDAVELARRIDLPVAQIPSRVGEDVVELARGYGIRIAPVAVYGRDDVLREAARLISMDVEYVLVDAVKGSEVRYKYGLKLPWELVERLASMEKIALAGGIAPESAERLAALRPYMVDVASGVESSPGVKDRGKVLALARALGKV
jgi:phosphoribosylanthranilate isomerase